MPWKTKKKVNKGNQLCQMLLMRYVRRVFIIGFSNMGTINVLAKSSFSEIMELKFEMSLRNNRRSGIEDSKYRTDFSRFSTTKKAVADGEIEVKIVFGVCFYLFVCLLILRWRK